VNVPIVLKNNVIELPFDATSKTPLDLDCQWWLDGSSTTNVFSNVAATTTITDGGAVAAWKTKGDSVFSFTRTAASGANPIYRADAGDGSPALQFDGSNDFLDATTPFSGLTEIDMYVVWASTTAVRTPWGIGTGQSYYPFSDSRIWESALSNRRYILGDPATDLTAFHLYRVSSTADLWQAQINGRDLFTAVNNVIATAGRLGANATSFGGYMRHIVVFPRILTKREDIQFRAWAATQATLATTAEAPDYPLLKAGNFAMRVRKGYYYAPTEIIDVASGRQQLTQTTITTATDSGNGTVLTINSVQSGPYHGNGAAVSQAISVDGIPRIFPSKSLYEGDTINWECQYTIGGGYRVEERSEITDSQIDSTVDLIGIDAAKTAANCLARLWATTDRWTNWATYDANGALVGSPSSGTIANLNNNSNTTLSASTSTLLLRDPATNDTISFRWSGHLSKTPVPYIQDQSGLNKLYLRLDGMNGACNQTVNLTERITLGTYADSWPPSSPTGL
jgi:hypothetical protein